MTGWSDKQVGAGSWSCPPTRSFSGGWSNWMHSFVGGAHQKSKHCSFPVFASQSPYSPVFVGSTYLTSFIGSRSFHFAGLRSQRPSLPVAVPASRRQVSIFLDNLNYTPRYHPLDLPPSSTIAPRQLLLGVTNYHRDMIRQIPLRAAAAAPTRLLATPAFRPSPFLTTARFLTTEPSAATQASTPTPTTFTKDTFAATVTQTPSAPARTLTYLVERTASGLLPVYADVRSGGTRKETVIRKIAGNTQDLKKDILDELKFKKDHVNINPVTGHIRIKVSSGGTDRRGCLRDHWLNYPAGSSPSTDSGLACGTRTIGT